MFKPKTTQSRAAPEPTAPIEDDPEAQATALKIRLNRGETEEFARGAIASRMKPGATVRDLT